MKRQRLIGQSALQAFRADVPADASAPTAEDQAAVLVATLLRQSLAADDTSVAERVREEALITARESLGAEALAEGSTYDDHPATSPTDVVRLLSQRTDRSGRLRLAEHMLESAAAVETDPIDSGRILADRARTSRKLGQFDLSHEQNLQLLRDARRLKSPELAAKAHMGLAGLAETRGNFVELRLQTQKVVRVAKAARLNNLLAAGYSGLGTISAVAGRYGDAVTHLWKAYQMIGGRGHIALASLGNLAQTLLISGRPTEARKISTVILQGRPPRASAIPSLGTFAIASAQLADADAVRWAYAQVQIVANGSTDLRDMAEALMECSAALEAAGESIEAGMAKRRAESLAEQYHLHALTFAEAMQSIRALRKPQHFNGAAMEAAAAIHNLEVPRIPDFTAALAAV